MPQSIPPGLKKEHVLRALEELNGGIDHPFGSPTGYVLVHGGKRYAPKAVVGLAFRHHQLGRVLLPEEFSGGEAPGQANHVLRQLGFTVERKGEEADVEEKRASRDWTGQEVASVVADYFAMLEKELLGKPLNKAEHNRSLVPRLNERSSQSIEYKHGNISAVLARIGLPYIEGYKPRSNYQALLAQEVEAFLDREPGFLERLVDAPVVNPEKGPESGGLVLDKVREQPPEEVAGPDQSGKPWQSRKGRRIDFALRDAQNRRLGALGEEFVVWYERQRLLGIGRDDLAGKVLWAAERWGDGLGFDVLSFDDQDGSERLIEVKTTGLGKHFPFYVTANEVRCSEGVPDQFRLFRVFDLSRVPRLYVLAGALRERCRLEPTQYRALIDPPQAE